MREFVGEHYLSAEAVQDAARCATAARVCSDQLRQEGMHVYHLRSIFIPEDETCIHLYRAESIETVRVAAARASLPLDRLTEAVSDTRGGGIGRLLRPTAGPGPFASSVTFAGDTRERLSSPPSLAGPGGALMGVTPSWATGTPRRQTERK
jgi:hypothetical protein